MLRAWRRRDAAPGLSQHPLIGEEDDEVECEFLFAQRDFAAALLLGGLVAADSF
jgi:hypothetical protein